MQIINTFIKIIRLETLHQRDFEFPLSHNILLLCLTTVLTSLAAPEIPFNDLWSKSMPTPILAWSFVAAISSVITLLISVVYYWFMRWWLSLQDYWDGQGNLLNVLLVTNSIASMIYLAAYLGMSNTIINCTFLIVWLYLTSYTLNSTFNIDLAHILSGQLIAIPLLITFSSLWILLIDMLINLSFA